MATLQSGKCFTVPTFFGMCCKSEWQERMYIYKWHEVDQTKHEIFCVHIVCNEIQVKVNLEITTFFFYLRFPYCPNFFWFGVVLVQSSINISAFPDTAKWCTYQTFKSGMCDISPAQILCCGTELWKCDLGDKVLSVISQLLTHKHQNQSLSARLTQTQPFHNCCSSHCQHTEPNSHVHHLSEG